MRFYDQDTDYSDDQRRADLILGRRVACLAILSAAYFLAQALRVVLR